MRLWHKDLIDVLPKQQLLGQWRECCLIAKNIKERGYPNHLLVNKIIDYNYDEKHFVNYCNLVYNEMKKRGANIDWEKVNKYFTQSYFPKNEISALDFARMFVFWHDYIYLRQCYYNLEEKYMCGGISEEEWKPINARYLEKEIYLKGV